MEKEKIVATVMGGAKGIVGVASSSDVSLAAGIVGLSVSEVKIAETEVKNGETESNKPQIITSAADIVGFSVSEVKNGETEAKNGETDAKNGETEVKNDETEAKNGETEVNKPQIITSPMQLIPDVLRTKTVETMSELDARKAALEMKKIKKALMEGESATWNVEM